jgi:hypothetical protein
VARVIEVWYLEGFFAYSRHYWKPFFAGTCAVVGLAVAGWILSGYTVLVVGSGVGAGAFLAGLYASRLEEIDWTLVRTYFDGFR